MSYAGVDVGTSWVKVLIVDGDGADRARARVPLPPLRTEPTRDGALAVTQDPLRLARAVEDALGQVADTRPWASLAVTTQRDTLLLVDHEEEPRSPLASWRDTRGDLLGVLLAASGLEPGQLRARSVVSWLAARWTGVAAETEATVPSPLRGAEGQEVARRLGTEAVPCRRPVGARVGEWNGIPVHLTAGDKNCEFLAAGIRGSERAGLSLGSAVSLGILAAPADQAPPPSPGVVVTGAAVRGRWNLETGLIVGMDGGARVARMVGLDPAPGPEGRFRAVPVLRPWFAPALDGAGHGVRIGALERATAPSDLFQAWAQGVVAEVARLQPLLEEAGGAAIREVRLGGGGAAEAGWAPLVAAALDVPVRRMVDPWAGARGAVASALLAEDPDAGATFLQATESRVTAPLRADAEARERARAWMEDYAAITEEST